MGGGYGSRLRINEMSPGRVLFVRERAQWREMRDTVDNIQKENSDTISSSNSSSSTIKNEDDKKTNKGEKIKDTRK